MNFDLDKEIDNEIAKMIKTKVDLAHPHQFRMERVSPGTGERMTADERRDFLTRSFVEISKGMGLDRFMHTPAERLDQYAVMTVMKNHDTQGMLRSLVNSFMIAYACPETADRAFAALVQIEGLRAEVADSKGQGRMSNKPELVLAAEILDAQLREAAGPHHTSETPIYKVLVGADRLYVKSSYPLKNVPPEINGFPVESVQHIQTH